MYIEDFWQLGDYIAEITGLETTLIQENEIINSQFSIIEAHGDFITLKHDKDTEINMFYDVDDAREYVDRWCKND